MEWLIGFVSAVFGYLMQRFGATLGSSSHNMDEKDIIERRWYEYHYSRQNSRPILRHNLLLVKRKSRNVFNVKTSAEGNYEGILVKERSHLVIHLRGVGNYQALWEIRLQEPVPENDKIIPGLWLSFDFDGQIISGPIILSQAALSDEQAERYLRQLIQITHTDYRLLGTTKAE